MEWEDVVHVYNIYQSCAMLQYRCILFTSSFPLRHQKRCAKIVFFQLKKTVSKNVFFTSHFSMPRNIKTNIQALEGLVLLQGLCQSFRSVPLDVIVPNLNLHDTTSPQAVEEEEFFGLLRKFRKPKMDQWYLQYVGYSYFVG